MNQKLKNLFTKKVNKAIAIMLMFALLLTMVPAFVLPVAAAEGDFSAAQAANGGNYVTLSWSGANGSKYAISKSSGGDVYETIPLKYDIKVLNVYPNAGNNLQTWMNTNNMGSPTINGTKYTMQVVPVSMTDFNNSPDTYLGTAGSWKYDVVYFGGYDSNNSLDINSTERDSLEKFINANGGVLLGHDTASFSHVNFKYLAANYLNLQANEPSIPAGDPAYIPTYGNSQVKVTRKGLLTNYPYTLGDVGTIMSTPESHSYHEFASGNVWFSYNGTDNSWDPTIPEMTTYNSKSGTNNFYLTTLNNMAMIQTGHSNGTATVDEQKILANTLYYLAQTTNQTSFDDHSAQDLTAPSTVAGTASVLGNTITFPASTDTGNTYNYKLYTVDDTACTKTDTGKKASATVTSGIKGYSIAVDKNSNKIGLDATVDTTSASYNIGAKDPGTYYLHVKAVDNAGNASDESILPFTVASATFNAPASLVYDGTSKVYTATVSGATLTAGTDYTLTYTGFNGINYNSTTAPKDAGDYTVTFALTSSGQEKCGTSGALTTDFTITPAPLTVTPKNGQSKSFGTVDPVLTYAYSGNISGEIPAFTGALSRSTGDGIGSYTITKGSLALTSGTGGFLASNYTLVFSGTAVNFAVTAYNPAERATLSSPNGNNVWYKEGVTDITLTAPEGFTISTTGTLSTSDWTNSITVDKTDGSGKTANYYLKRTSDGAISAALTSSYNVDTVAPSNPTISYGTESFKEFLNTITFGLFFKDTVTVTLTSTDAVSSVKEFKYTLNGTEHTIAATSGSASFTIEPQYKGNISNVKAIDNAGNESAIKNTEYFAVDKQIPATPTVTANGYTSGTWTNGNVTFIVSGASSTSSVAKYQYSTDSGATWSDMTTTDKTDATATEPYNATKAELTISTNSANNSGVSYRFRAVSNAGNDGAASSAVVVKIDKTLPAVSSVDCNPSSWTKDDVTLTVTAADALSGMAPAAYSFDGGLTWQTSNTKSFDSNQTVNIKVKDSAENISTSTTVEITKIDKTAPVVSSVDGNPSSWTKDNVTLTITAADTQSGLAAAAYSFDDGATWQADNTKSFDSNQTVKIKVQDADGNVSEATTVEIAKIDKTAPSNPTISYGTDNFKEFLNTVTFGLFFKDTVTVTLTATDAGSSVKEFKYTLNGTEQTIPAASGSASFNIEPQYKGNISAVKAIDNAGNESAGKATEYFSVDNQNPPAPTVNTNGYTSGTWTKEDIKITVSGANAVSGIAKYQYSADNGSTWSDMVNTEESAATATESYNVIKAEVTINSDMNGSVLLRAVSNSCVEGVTASVPVKRDTKIPKLSIDVTGTTGQWTYTPVTFTLSDTANNVSPVTYWVKIGSDNWTQLSGNTCKVSGNVNTTYQFKAVSGSGLESSPSDTYTVKLASDALKEVIKDIDNLPDPGSASDKQITDNEQLIKDTKILFDTLSKDEQSAVGQSRIDKLNKLISRLNSLLVIIPKDTDTGITAGNIGTSVNLPELNDPEVGKVVVKLAVNPITSSGTQRTNFAIASISLDQSRTNLLAAFDVSLIKSVFDSAGNQTSTGKVSNSSINGPITILIPVPVGYQGRTDLQVVYIDDSGNVTPLTTTLVTIDGVQYLQFTTTHFSVYAVTAPEKTSSTPNTGDSSHGLLGAIPLFGLLLLSASAAIVLYRRKNKKSKTSR